MGLFPFLTRGSGKVIHAKVTTMDADLDRIVIETSWTGRHLFDAVCRIIGLREVWFFGLQFTNKKGLPCWLQMDKEIRKQDVPRGEDGCMQFLFLVKFYPEDVEDELIQDLTRHLFFLQIKQAILSMDLYCSPEASVLLASFAVQAINGDCTDDIGPLDLDKLLPKSVIEQYDMSADMWRERIKRWWINNHGQTRARMHEVSAMVKSAPDRITEESSEINKVQDSLTEGFVFFDATKSYHRLRLRLPNQAAYQTCHDLRLLIILLRNTEDAEMEYLRVAQDLEMYGILYYPICNKKETDLHLGISAQGLGIYKGSNRITPRPFFSWSEIKNISFKNKKFHMKTVDKSTISFRAQERTINPSILDLCIGTHNLYLRRRQPDTLEVQQMKALAKEERARRQQEAARLAREREERLQAETERNQLKAEIEKIAEQLAQAKLRLKQTPLEYEDVVESTNESTVKDCVKNPFEFIKAMVKLSAHHKDEAARKTEETAELLAEKARASEQETLMLTKRVSEAEAECHRLQMNHVKSEEALMRMERKAREAELYAQRISMSLADVNSKPHYASHALISEPTIWPLSNLALQGTLSHHQLMTSGGSQEGDRSALAERQLQVHQAQQLQSLPQPSAPIYRAIPPNIAQMMHAPPPPDPSVNQRLEFHNLRSELEKSRQDFSEKARLFKERLNDFRNEIDALKREERQTEHDMIHAQNVHNGFDKFTTLRMSSRGAPKQRVEVFEGL